MSPHAAEAGAAQAFAQLAPEESIWQGVCRQLAEVAGDVVAAVNQIEGDSVRVRCVTGLTPEQRTAVEEALGHAIEGMTVPGVYEEARQEWATGRLVEVPGGLADVFFGRVAPAVCKRITDVLGIRQVHAVGLHRGEKLFGSITVFSLKGTDFSDQMIEGFAAQASVAVERALDEAALVDSERTHRLLAENTLDVIWAMDMDLVFSYVNPAIETLTGYTCEEWIGTHLSEHCTREAFAEMKQIIAGELARGPDQRGVVFETEMLRKDGSAIPIEIHGKVVFDEDSRPTGLQGTTRDITERKRAEAQRERQARFQQDLLDAVPVPVFYKDAEARYLGVNRAFEEFFGATAADMIGKTVHDIAPPDLAALYAERDAELLAHPGKQVYESEVKDTGGKRHEVVFHEATFEDAEGRVAGLIGAILDITQLKQAVRASSESEQLLSEVIDMSPTCIFLKDPEGRYMLANRAVAGLYDMEPDRMLGTTDGELAGQFRLTHDTAEAFAADDREVIRSGRLKTVPEEAFIRPDGEVRWFQTIKVPIDLAGRGRCLLGVATDITRHKAMEQQLRQAQKMEAVGQLAGGVAHDFRNQLQVIQGYGAMLVRRGEIAPEGQDKMNEILAAVDRSARLTGQLLAFSRREMLQSEVSDPAELIRDLEKSLPKIIGDDIRVVTSFAPHAGCAMLDPAQFQQAILNLCINARDAMPGGGELYIDVNRAELGEEFLRPFEGAAPGRYVEVAVTDTGAGMDEHTRARVFDPFFTTKATGKGTGLGLSMVYGFVTQSEGAITCESEPGKGTTLRMYFPVVTAAREVAGMETERAERPRGSGTVLLVEDEEPVRKQVAAEVEEAGYTVLAAEDADAALRMLAEHEGSVDALLTDVVMPGMSGAELAREVADTYPDIEILFISGYAGQELVRRGLEGLRDRMLMKPIDTDELLSRLAEFLKSRGNGGSDTGR